MKQRFNSIEGRIAICSFISILFLTLVISYYFYAFHSSVNRQLRLNFEQASSEMEYQIQERLSLIDQMVKTIGYSNAMQKYIFSSTPADQILNKVQATRDVSMWSDMYSSHVMGVYFIGSRHVYSNHQYLNQMETQLDVSLEIPLPQLENAIYTPIFQIDDDHPSCFFYAVPLRNVLTSSASGKRQSGLGIVLCDLTSLTALSQLPENSLCMILYEGRVVSSNRELSEKDTQLLQNVTDGKERFQQNQHYYLSHTSVIPGTEWNLVFIIPERSVIDVILASQNSMFWLIIVGSIIVLSLHLILIHSVSRAVGHMIDDINIQTSSHSGRRIWEPKMTELRTLSVQINNMLNRIDQSVKEKEQDKQKLFEMAIAQQEAEITAYRSQINPHFLFNTLECMRSMACYYQAQPLEQMVTSMADLFRYSLYANNVVPLEQEINHLRSYICLMSLRYPGQYCFSSDIDPATMDCPVPSMLLQPLAENVIQHAFAEDQKPGPKEIILHTTLRENNQLCIQLTDNGCGMMQNDLDHLNNLMLFPDENETDKPKKDSIGIQNIFKRLKLYSPDCQMHYDSEFGKYTIVELLIPVLTDIAPFFYHKKVEPYRTNF